MARAIPRLRALLGWLALVGVGAAAGLWVSGTAQAQQEQSVEGSAERGGELYQRWCAVCHGTDGGGTYAGPSLLETSLAYNDLTMRTGRMPLTDPTLSVRERQFTDQERADTVAYLAEMLGLEGTVAEPGVGDPRRGQDVYVLQCGACHGPTGAGGIAGDGTLVPATRDIPVLAIAQATRVGPFQMPAFNEQQISDEELDDLVAFLEPPASSAPWDLGELDRAAVALFAVLLAAMLALICAWAGRPVPLPDIDEEEP